MEMGEEKGKKEQDKKKEEDKKKEMKISDIFGGSLNILGLEIDIGKLLSLAESSGRIAEDLEKLRGELEKAGGKVRVDGYIRTRPILGARVPTKFGQHRKRGIKTIYVEKETEEPERLVDIFEEKDTVRVVAEIPLQYKEEELKLEYQRKNGEGEVIIRAPGDYERRISMKGELAVKLTGKVKLRSLKNGVADVELEKKPQG